MSLKQAFQMPEIENVQVVVLMGGTGSRLKDATKTVPKPMISVCGNPFFLYQFKLLLLAGFKKFLFLVGYRSVQIQNFFGDGSQYGVKIEYSYDGSKQLGTAGAIVQAYEKLNDSFILLYGDTLLDIDYFEIVYRFFKGKENGRSSLMAVYRNEGKLDSSNVRLVNGEIVAYNKKHPSVDMHYIDYGISVFDKAIFSTFVRGEYLDLSDIQMKLSYEGKMSTCIVRKRFYEIGTPDALTKFGQYACKRYYTKQKAVFVDRDGVINSIVFNENTEQLDSPLDISEFEFIDGAINGLKMLNNKGYLLFIITNQPAAAKGKATLEKLYDINGYMLDELKKYDIEVDGIQMCPHHPVGAKGTKEHFLIKKCNCRKPATKMIDDVLAKYCIDKQNSYMIGDSYTDIQAGKSAGLKTAFIGDLKCDVCQKLNYNKPDIVAKNLYVISELL